MKISIADTEKTPFWGIPEAEIHLSEEANEAEVDYSKLTPYQQQTLFFSLKTGVIESEDAEEFKSEFIEMLKGYIEKREKNQVEQMRNMLGVNPQEQQKAVENVQRVKELKKIMEGSVATLKKTLPDFSAADLELAHRVESVGKGRKSVLKLINELIKKQTKESVSKVVDPNAPNPEEFQLRQTSRGDRRDLLSNLSSVVESDIEQVEIKT